MRIIQFGYGTVGKSFAQLVSHRDDLHIESIGVRASKPREGDFEFTTEVNELLKSGNADVFVELTDDPEFSWKVALAAAERGIPLVTANKAMVAQNLNDLQSLKSDNKLKLLYESSCAGAIPIIRTLDQYHRLGVQKVEGILNGSCNYILDRIFSKGDSFEDALEQAQQAGYAESNPSLDLSGKDAAYKLSILIDKAYGVKVQDSDLLLSGIDKLGESEFAIAKAKRWNIKLIARTFLNEDQSKLSGWVAPVFVRSDEQWGNIPGAKNAVRITDFTDQEHWLIGDGAGGVATAGAVLNDVLALKNGYSYNSGLENNDHLEFTNDQPELWYIRYTRAEHHEVPEREILQRWRSEKHVQELVSWKASEVKQFLQSTDGVAVQWLDLGEN